MCIINLLQTVQNLGFQNSISNIMHVACMGSVTIVLSNEIHVVFTNFTNLNT